MGIFGSLTRSWNKTKVVMSASQTFGYNQVVAMSEVFKFISTDPPLLAVTKRFNAAPPELLKIAQTFLQLGYSDVVDGKGVPIAAICDEYTLSYLLRGERGQVNRELAYRQVRDYIVQGGAGVFMPEVAYRSAHGG